MKNIRAALLDQRKAMLFLSAILTATKQMTRRSPQTIHDTSPHWPLAIVVCSDPAWCPLNVLNHSSHHPWPLITLTWADGSCSSKHLEGTKLEKADICFHEWFTRVCTRVFPHAKHMCYCCPSFPSLRCTPLPKISGNMTFTYLF